MLLAHVAVDADAELSVGLLLLFALAAVFVPTLAGLWTARPLGASGLATGRLPFLHGMAAGILLFLFIDFMLLTAFLGMSGTSGWRQVILLGLFLAPLVIVPWLDFAGARRLTDVGLLPLWAVGIGLHSFSEGLVMGHNLTLGLGLALRALPVASFVLHKVGEGFSAAVLYAGRVRPTWRSILALAAIAGLPALPGVVMGYGGVSGGLAAYFYALAAGVLVVILPAFLRTDGVKQPALYAGVAVGFILMYLTGVLHEL